jgi:membrane-associated protein
MHQLLDIFLHLDQHLSQWILLFGPGIYGLLFLVLFSETGLIVFPFLPGDSLLFALGALAAGEHPALSFPLLCVLLSAAAVLGDAVNYWAGRHLGLKLFADPDSKLFRREHLSRTQEFYDRHGGKTIILARFIPIIRTFAPFVAGVAEMPYGKFFAFNVVGGLGWVLAVLFAGHLFGNLPVMKRNFHLVVLAIIVISLIPLAVEGWKAKRSVGAAGK